MENNNGSSEMLHEKENIASTQPSLKHSLNPPFINSKTKLKHLNSTPIETPLGDKGN